MTDLVEWLETAISEREAAAREAYGVDGQWIASGNWTALRDSDGDLTELALLGDAAEHVALNDPDAVLRRCAADRKILKLHGRMLVGGPNSPFFNPAYVCLSCEPTQFADNAWPCQTIRVLAEGYDYQEAANHG